MFNLHIFSRFLRLVRSIRRSLFAFFVAIAMLLATFVIAPTYALSAGENTGESATSTEKVEGAKSGSAKNDSESNKQPEHSESNNNTESNKGDTGSSNTLNKDNKESNLVEKQPKTAGNNGVDKAKSSDSDVKKNAKDTQKKSASTDASSKMERGANEKPELPKECKDAGIDELAKCYVAEYKVKNGKSYVIVNEAGGSYTAKPVFHRVISINKKSGKLIIDEKKDVSSSVKSLIKSFSLEGIVVDKKPLDLKEEANNFVEVDSTSGALTIRPNKWLKKGYHDVYVRVDYKDNSALTHPESCADHSKDKKDKGKVKGYEEYSQFRVKIRYNDPKNNKNNVLSLKVYNHQKADGRTEVDETNGVKFTLNKDGKFNPSTIFIDSQSSGKFNPIYHRMICHKDSDSDYYLNSINGLTLSDSADGVSGSNPPLTQKQWKHVLGTRDTDKNPLNDSSGELYESDSDSIGERSQSWITTGTPNVGSEGKYTCKVFAIKDTKLSSSGGGKDFEESTVLDEFDTRVETNKQSLFEKPEQNIVEGKWTNKASIKQGVDWDYKSVTIEVMSSNPPKPNPPKISDNDLTLKVYPFKNDDGPLPAALPDKDNSISAILGMSLKPFVDATSAADSTKKITLRVLCSKGEKKENAAGGGGDSTVGAGSTGSGSSGANTGADSQSEQPSKQSQSAEDPEYKTWSSNLDELGLSVPEDTDQTRCNEAGNGDKKCTAKNVASQASMEVSIKPTEVGNYQCVVFALKNDALTKFDGLKGSLTPTSIKSSLTAAPASFKEHKDFAAFTFNIHLVSKFTLPHTGGQSWNLQLGILAALLVNLLAAGFVVSQSERGRKLILGRWRGLCNHV